MKAQILAVTVGWAVSIAGAQTCLNWANRPVSGPSARGEAGFAFDSVRSRSVLVGGANNLTFTGVFRETWEWDGAAWTLQSTDGPSARCDNAMAYDKDRQVVVSFGGYNGGFLADTWEWNGTAWTQRVVAGPSARADSFMVYDSARQVMVLFGGFAGGNVVFGDTWEWNGTVWTQRVLSGPSARWIHRMAYDSARQRTVLFGGASPPNVVLGETWEFDGTAWAQIAAAGPSNRYGHTMAYDSDRQVTLLFGGQTGPNFGQGVLGDTWQWDGTAWQSTAASGPQARSFAKMVYDSARKKAVVFGGYGSGGFRADTWEFGHAYADCDGVGGLTANDFQCFINAYAGQQAYANCDGSTGAPTLTANDFQCFLNAYAAGCV